MEDMDSTPDKYCTWEVDRDFLEESLGEIYRHGSTVVSVTASELNLIKVTTQTHKVSVYTIIYYNPATQVIPGIPGSGDPATIQ